MQSERNNIPNKTAMKVLLVNTYNGNGGAAIAAARLAKALKGAGVDVGMLTAEDFPRRRFLVQKAWERFVVWARNGFAMKNLWTVSLANTGFDITQTSRFRESDIIHLHWVNQGFLSMKSIKNILSSGKPVVWTMHDMWPLTGICHHAGECDGYTHGCGNCPLLRFPSGNDFSAKVFSKKQLLWHDADIRFTAVSSWLKGKAEQSALMKDCQVAVIPNMLSADDFPLTDKQECRRRLNLPEGARIVAFGAAKLDDPVKGFGYLSVALSLFAPETQGTERVHLVLFGNIKGNREVFLSQIPVEYTYLGPLSHEGVVDVLNAADVVVSSSMYETFGQTLIEGMACGCVPVSFDGSGQRDIILHKENGYLAKHLNTADLAAGIRWAFEAPLKREDQRKWATDHYSQPIVAKQFIELYETAIRVD